MAKTVKIKLDEKLQNKLAELRIYYKTKHGISEKALNQALFEYVINSHYDNIELVKIYLDRTRQNLN